LAPGARPGANLAIGYGVPLPTRTRIRSGYAELFPNEFQLTMRFEPPAQMADGHSLLRRLAPAAYEAIVLDDVQWAPESRDSVQRMLEPWVLSTVQLSVLHAL
jgi:hypothetical protein